MSKKSNIFSKLNVNTKNINMELEQILDKKNFSEEVQSLTLSMFYKIENSYSDYFVVKRQMPTEEIYIKSIIDIINKYCNNIEIIKTSGNKNEKKYKVKLEEKSLECLENESYLLFGILSLIEEKYKKEDLIDVALSDFFKNGNSLNYQEVIRAFNGWSWLDSLELLNDIQINIIYQNLLIILGNELLQKIIANEGKLKIIHKEFEKKFEKDLSNRISTYIAQIVISIKINNSEKYKSELEKYLKPLHEEYLKLDNKEKLVSYIAEKRKEITNKIGDIDMKLNNIEFLKKDFKERNEKLEKHKKLFSISNLVEIYENERKKLLKDMKDFNKIVDPKYYLQIKEELENKVKFYDELNFNVDKKIDIEKLIIDFQEIFLECFEEKIKQSNSKKVITDLLYNYRYYINLNYKKGHKIKDSTRIKKRLNYILQLLLSKGQELKAIEKISNNIEADSEIVKNIFTNEIINLNNILIQINNEKENDESSYIVQYYDGTMLIKEIKIDLKNVLFKKRKIRLLI